LKKIKVEEKFFTGEDEDAYETYLASCLSTGQESSSTKSERMVLNGLGRSIALTPILDQEERSIVGYSEARLVEGHFENDALHGFGRMIRSDGYSAVGWWRNGYLMGYAKQIQPDRSSREGLYEVMPKDRRYIRMFDAHRDLIAKPIRIDNIIKYSEEVSQRLKERQEKEELKRLEDAERRR